MSSRQRPDGTAGHPENPPPGPLLTPDDLLDLHERLASPDWLSELLALVVDPDHGETRGGLAGA